MDSLLSLTLGAVTYVTGDDVSGAVAGIRGELATVAAAAIGSALGLYALYRGFKWILRVIK